MKICIDARGINWYSGTGIGTYTRRLIKEFVLNDYEADLSLIWCGEGYRNYYGKDTKIYLTSKKHRNFFENMYIGRLLKDTGTDLYHVPQNGIGFPSYKNCCYVSTIHDLIPYVLPDTVGRSYKKKFLLRIPEVINLSDIIITVSEFSKKDIMRIFGLSSEKICVTPLSADECYFPFDKNIAQEVIRSKYGIKNSFILYVGGYSKRKNIPALIDSFSCLKQEIRKNYCLVLAGADKTSESDIYEKVCGYGLEENVIFTGFVPTDDLPFFYNASDLFVYPSIYEGFGLPPLEAMSCGIPVIASDAASIPETSGKGALLINPYDIDKLTLAITEMLEDESLREKYASVGLEHSQNFSWSATAKKTFEAYSNILNS